MIRTDPKPGRPAAAGARAGCPGPQWRRRLERSPDGVASVAVTCRPAWRAPLTGRLSVRLLARLRAGVGPRDQPSYSNPIFSSTRYSTISPSSIRAVDFTTSIVRMLRTVFEAVATAWRAASDHDLGLDPTISRMMITPTAPPRASVEPA